MLSEDALELPALRELFLVNYHVVPALALPERDVVISLFLEKVKKLFLNDVVFVSLLIDLVFAPLEELLMVSGGVRNVFNTRSLPRRSPFPLLEGQPDHL